MNIVQSIPIPVTVPIITRNIFTGTNQLYLDANIPIFINNLDLIRANEVMPTGARAIFCKIGYPLNTQIIVRIDLKDKIPLTYGRLFYIYKSAALYAAKNSGKLTHGDSKDEDLNLSNFIYNCNSNITMYPNYIVCFFAVEDPTALYVRR